MMAGSESAVGVKPLRILFCGTAPECDAIARVAADGSPSLELTTFSENGAPGDILWPGGKPAIEAVIASQSWISANHSAAITAMVGADDGLRLIIEAATIESMADYIMSDRVMAVPQDHPRALQLASALARQCRLERANARARQELRSAQRAAQLVSTEFLRQRRDQDQLFET